MTQTVKGKKDAPQPQKQYRPGQRQQDRLLRQARRRRQVLLLRISGLCVVLVVLAGIGIWQYPNIVALFQHPQAKPVQHISSTCSVATSTPAVYASTPAQAPAAPPKVATAPATLTGGLQCIDLKVGTGPAAAVGSYMTLEYTGWYASNGHKISSSFDTNTPLKALLGQGKLIKGLEEGLTGIKQGGIRRIIIPPALAYNSQGALADPPVPANTKLVFDVIATSVNSCTVATNTNIYNVVPTPGAVGPVIPPTPTAGPTKPPVIKETPAPFIDGIQCIDLKVGTGPAAQRGSVVSVEYTGWLEANGKKFDSSYDRKGQPYSVTLGQGQVIKGWDEGLIGVKAGGTRRLIIPAALAYGAQGSPPVIPPNSVLVFDVTILSVQ